MAHKFDINNRKQLDGGERRRLLAPYETLTKLGYQKGDSMADIGCGTGLFTIPAAETGGTVYAVDVSEEMLSDVKKRAETAGFNNVTTVKSDEYDFKLLDEAVNFVLICTVLHEVEDKKRFLQEARRICRAEGKIAVIEFNETNTDFGPPLSHRLSGSQVAELFADAGFGTTAVMDISEAFYAVVAKNSN